MPTTNLATVDLTNLAIPEEVLRIIPPAVAAKYGIIAFEKRDKTLKLAAGEPERLREDFKSALDEFAQRRGFNIELFTAPPEQIAAALERAAKLPPRLKFEAPTPYVDLTREAIPLEILEKFPREIADKYGMVVFGGSAQAIKVAALSPKNPKVQEILRFIREKNDIAIDLFQTDAESMKAALLQYEGILPPAVVEKERTRAVKKVKEERKIDKSSEKPTTLTAEREGAEEAEEKETPPPATESKPERLAPTKVKDEHNLDHLLGRSLTSVEDLEGMIKKGQVPLIVAAMISLAVAERASDIHLEPQERQFRLRYRIDGILRTVILMPLSLHPPVISRIKILSEMKIDEQRVPQDGRYDVKVGEKNIDLRISTLPTVHGEKVVIRLLDKSTGILTLSRLGLSGRAYEAVIREIHKPYGVVLSTGPTGSGKSTTLYAVLHEIATPQVNVITLEDPVEYEIPGINQSQVKPAIGYSFAEGLRSILRQDPNIIMVGETRDAETASMVTHAALTGHLVLSTLHTNDVASALPRLINMGVEPFLITSAVNCIIGQRLVRKICVHCKEETKVPTELAERITAEIANNPPLKEAIGDKPIKFHKGKGCGRCNQGYHGRIGVYEVLAMSEAIEELALKNAPASAIAQEAQKEGMLSMFQDGIVKAVQGITSLDEVFRVTSTS
jgi:type IV pilus assembly protein PilB